MSSSAYASIVSKLELLQYPRVANIKQQQQLSANHEITFHEFTCIVNFLENQFIRLLDENDRAGLRPIDHTGDFMQYINHLTNYLEALTPPPILVALASKIISEQTAQQTAQLQSASNGNQSGQGPNGGKLDDDVPIVTTVAVRATVITPTTIPNGPKSPSPRSIAESKARLQLLTFLIAKSIEFESTDTAETLQEQRDVIAAQQQEHQKEQQQRLLLSKPESTSTTPNNKTPQLVLFDKYAHALFPFSALSTVDLTTFNNNITTYVKDDKNKNTPINRELDRLTTTMVTPTKIHLRQLSQLPFYTAIPVGPNNLQKQLFDIVLDDENSMSLWQYIFYVSSLFAYIIPITTKMGLFFFFPRELYDFVVEFHNATQKADPTTTATTPTTIKTTKPPLQYYYMAKASYTMLTSLFREFTRRIQGEFTTVLLALKTFEPTQSTNLSESLLHWYNEQTNPSTTPTAANTDSKGVVLAMPSHIVPSSTSNFKKDDKKLTKQQLKKTPSGNAAAATATTAATPVKADSDANKTAAEEEAKIDTSKVPKTTLDSTTNIKVKQKRLAKEQFAKRNVMVTDYINDRYHLSKLLLLSSLQSHQALEKMSTLSTLPIGLTVTSVAQIQQLTPAQQEEMKTIIAKQQSEESNTTPAAQSTIVSGSQISMGDDEQGDVVNSTQGDKEKDKADDTKTTKNGKAGGKQVNLTPEMQAKIDHLKSSPVFLSILTTLIRMLYDQNLQQHQTVVTRWIQYLQTFTVTLKK